MCIKAVVFDWGDTLMVDYPEKQGPMYLWDEVTVIDGAIEVLDFLKQKTLCAVASNAGDSNAEVMKLAFERVRLLEKIECFYTAKELAFKKPELEFYSSLVHQLGFLPGECMMVGNDPAKDIIPAKQCGMKTVFYNPECSIVPIEADYSIGKLTDLIEVMKEEIV